MIRPSKGCPGRSRKQAALASKIDRNVRRQQIGFLIAERRQPLPQLVTQIGNVFESNGTDVVFRPVTEIE